MDEQKSKTQLEKVWKRFEALCADLWVDSSPRAVTAQSLLEEYRGEMARFDAQVVNANEHLAKTTRVHEEAVAALRSHYSAEMDGLKKRIDLLEHLVKDKDAEISTLLASIAEHEKRNAEFHAQVLKMAAASDEAASQQIKIEVAFGRIGAMQFQRFLPGSQACVPLQPSRAMQTHQRIPGLLLGIDQKA